METLLILNISRGINRPSQLQRINIKATRRVLNQQLKALEGHGIVFKIIHAELPLKVEYFLTEQGKSLLPLLEVMNSWGEQYSQNPEEVPLVKLSDLAAV